MVDSEGLWREAWRALGAVASGEGALYQEVMARYAEPQRHYHSQQHLQECLEHFADARLLAERPAEVLIALFFHDAIYQPKRHDNEERSAAWARDVLLAAGVDPGPVERVQDLILATRHQELPVQPDAQLLVDIDLAILGAKAERFAEYEKQVRAEYAFVPGWIFRRKRRAILRDFFARPRLYSSSHFHALLEQNARDNLRRAIDG